LFVQQALEVQGDAKAVRGAAAEETVQGHAHGIQTPRY
jgi:hypothetical protein